MKAEFLYFTQKYPIKERIFLYYMVFCAFLAAFTVVINMLYGFDFSYNYKWMIICLFCTILIIPAVQRKYLGIVHRIGIYCLVFVLLPGSWLASAGLVSPSILYSVLILILINYLCHGWERFFLNVGMILMHMALITLFYVHPEVFKSIDRHEQYFDWIVNVPVLFVFIVMLLVTFEKAYEDERVMNEEKSAKLLRLSQTDPLTGLYNRSTMRERLDLLHSLYARTRIPYSLILIDTDFFKEYNDRYGHLKGDQCLSIVGEILGKRVVRDTDWAYRYGGDEFLVLLGFTDKQGACTVAELIQKDIQKAAISHKGAPGAARLTLSMGIATVHPEEKSPYIVLNHADQALYCSKNGGRNMIRHFDDHQGKC